ncbi:bud site selection-related protein [Pseudozyma hubeiensis SY62]|uniref:Bud site selection-related protein n=1 Tax=Pseudozyma hubeiensis (strain SY62) TaxID=1305764 RepID=R9P6M4_PSEHS|nr:bud site selection-related protein [Pseudozyma hubeiensis SY62]GAC97011.1 bud site selection-related protein [Pseudozyma hubeiensis SY62]
MLRCSARRRRRRRRRHDLDKNNRDRELFFLSIKNFLLIFRAGLTIMSKLLVGLSLFCFIFSLSEAAPPALKLLELADVALQHESVSTELTLGRPEQSDWSTEVSEHTHLSHDTEPVTSAGSHGQGFNRYLDASASPSSPITPSSNVASQVEAPTTQRALTPDLDLSRRVGVLLYPRTPGLDRSLESALIRPLPQGNMMVLPSQIDSVTSSWFERFYKDAILAYGSPPWIQRFFHEPIRSDIDDATIHEAMTRDLGILHGDALFRLKLPQHFSPFVDDGEVLIKHHDRLRFGRQRTLLRGQLSVWAATNRGTRLAFLGLFHCPPKLYKTFLEQTRADEMEVGWQRLSQDGGVFVLEPAHGGE